MADNRNDIFEEVRKVILNSELNEQDKNSILKNLNQKINIMITGATGVGKSSTINALFDADVAKVGIGSDPETMDIKKYTLKNLILWDSPGLGDGKEADARHSRNIIKKLTEKDSAGNYLIDLVLVILDGGTRDYGTDYKLINEVIIPNLGANAKDRILVAINKCDKAKSRHWNYATNQPEEVAKKFLEEKVASVRRRIRESTGVDIEPIYYSAGEKDSDDEKQNPYNLSKLLYYIIKHTPAEKRLTVMNNTSQDKDNWKDNQEPDILDKIKDTVIDTAISFIGNRIIDVVLPGSGIVKTATKAVKKFFSWFF